MASNSSSAKPAAVAKPAPAPKKAAAKPAKQVKAKIPKNPKPQPKPESLAKKAKLRSERISAKLLVQKRKVQVRERRRRVIFKRAEEYVREYRATERQLINARRDAKATGNLYVAAESKLAFVIRIRGINGVSPKPRKILQLLRLHQINNGTFVRLNKATSNMLKLVEPYISYGFPNLKTVKELIYKRGFGRIHHQRIPLTNNHIIRNALGKFNIICIEDLVHEIFTVGPHFKQANHFLWTFKLNSPRGGWTKKLSHFTEGGDAGNREGYINKLVRRMN